MSELEQLIENSRANEKIARKLFEIETEVLACKSSDSLLKHLLESIRLKFSLSAIHLLMVEPTPISYLLNANMQSSWQKKHTKRLSIEALTDLHPSRKPLLTNVKDELRNKVPSSLLEQGDSFALTPLYLEGKLFASLMFCDEDGKRFHVGLDTFLLEQLAVKVSMCLSNVLVREQLEYMAHYDRLTGIANRRLMEICLSEELIRQQRYGVPFSIIFIDCNKFKKINDTYGHDCGDQVLTYVASHLKELIRENDKCFRYAGDEFVVTLASQTYGEAILAANRLCQFFETHPMPYQGQKLEITISCGVAASDGSQNIQTLLKKADEQLYLHKQVNV